MSLWLSIRPTCRVRAHLCLGMAWALSGLACAQQQQPVYPTSTTTITQPAVASSQQPNAATANPNTAAPTTQPTVTQSPNATPADGNTPVAANPNAPLPNGNDVAITPTAAVVSPAIGFDGAPVNDKKAIALTFDDG